MFRFSAVVLASLLGGATASNPSIGSYEPVTTVTDHAGIAGDQAIIEKYCGQGDQPGMEAAYSVYQDGGHSKSVAIVTLTSSLANAISKGTPLTGKTENDVTVSGKAYEDYAVGSPTIGFQYTTSDDPIGYSTCQVGGLPELEQVTSGCLGGSGNVVVASDATALPYTSVENVNGRTIQGFSTGADTKFKPENSNDFFTFYEDYITYYGSSTFADRIAKAGFENTAASFSNGVSVDATAYGFSARCQIAKKATAYIITALYAQRELNDAIDDCARGCDTADCNQDSVHALDEAVAFYVGNRLSDGVGNMAYGLAEKRCKNFATCEDGTTGQSDVNKKIMAKFNELKAEFASRTCKDDQSTVQAGVDEIARLMMIPLIQGTLRYAYLTDTNESPTEDMQAEGFIFALGILPKIHACNPTAAATIYDNMKMGPSPNTKADFAEVKGAFESTYSCLQISCADVGGIVNEATGNTYIDGAAPCGGHSHPLMNGTSGSSLSYSMSVFGAVAAVFAALMM